MSNRTRRNQNTAPVAPAQPTEAELLAAEVAQAKADAQAAIDAAAAAEAEKPVEPQGDTPAAPAPSAVNAKRGNSSATSPVRVVHDLASQMLAASGHPLGHAENKHLRSRVVAAAQAAGVAYYTARTQFQVWYKKQTNAPAPLTPAEVLAAAEARAAQAAADLEAARALVAAAEVPAEVPAV
jgi:hypothetical protein